MVNWFLPETDLTRELIRQGDVPGIRAQFQKHPELIQARDVSEGSLLAFAARQEPPSFEVIRLLIELGLPINGVNQSGECALSLVARKGDVEIARWLIDHGADANVSAWPMIEAVSLGHLELVKLFVQHGADINCVFGHPKSTPLSQAYDYGHQEVAAHLFSLGATMPKGKRPQKRASHVEEIKGHFSKDVMTNETELARIEASLHISLPPEYRELRLSGAVELKEIGDRHEFFAQNLFLDPDMFIRFNQDERKKGMGAAEAFPRWWKNFVLIGTNGGGDYYCLRLEGDRHVWMIGSDCGNRPKKVFESLSDYINDTIQSYENPEPLPSSFDDSIPLLQRFRVYLSTDRCKLIALEGDRPLTAEKLQSHGVSVAEIHRCIRAIVAALANGSPESVQISDPAPPTDYGEFMIGFQPQPLADARFAFIDSVNIDRGDIEVEFRLHEQSAERTPVPKRVNVDWQRFQDGAVRLLQTLHPPGTRVTITRPKPESGGAQPRYAWSYTLRYSLKPR